MNGKQSDFLLSYICRIFVKLMERQVLPMDTHGKAKQIVSSATRILTENTARQGNVYGYERNAITFFIVIPLSYLCKVELNTNNYE